MAPPAAHDLGRTAREAAKQALRRYGEFTSPLRAGPVFAIIGAKRGGTTSLYNYMLEHPAIAPLYPGRQHIKGIHYFDSEFSRGPRWYRSHFPITIGSRRVARPWTATAIAGEASPYYLFHPLAAQRFAAAFPDLRIIVLLRDPVERAYSHYKERVRHNAEPLTFEAALDAEPARIQGEAERIIREPGYRSAAHEDHSYLAQGRYLDMLPRWFALFPREHFHLVASEDFYSDPDRVVNGAWSFLGLQPATLQSRTRHNYHPAPDIPAQTRERLQNELAEHNCELEKLVGFRLPWPAGRQSVPSARVPGRPGQLGLGAP
jgi:hypothetical protein